MPAEGASAGAPHPRLALVRRLVLFGAVAVTLGACSSQNVTSSDSSPTSAPGTSVSGTTPRGTTVAAVCTEAVLEVLVAQEVPGSALDDVTCGATGSDQAVATIVKDGAPDQVAFFVGSEDGWSLAAHAGVSAEPDKVVPKGFSLSLYRTWRDKYDLRRSSPVTTSRRRTPSKAPGTSTPGDGAWCNRVGDKVVCKDPNPTTTTTAPKPSTTTTTKPTTTVPPVTVTTAPAPKPPSAFCLANPFDPRCAADPSFPG